MTRNKVSRVTSVPRPGLTLVRETKAKGKLATDPAYAKLTFTGAKNDGPSRNLIDRVGVAVRMAVVNNSKDKGTRCDLQEDAG
jgi:hypothetical protein